MNLSDLSRARTLTVPGPYSDVSWKGYVTKAAILALGFGAYVLLIKKIDILAGGRWCFYRLRKYFPKGKDDPDAKSITGPVLAYNREVCPICLGAPKTGVRAPCGHLLCASCLASYCDIRGAQAPPCPLCRAPLNSVALASDVATLLSPDLPDVTVDAGTRAWVREYNLHQGVAVPRRRSRTAAFLTWWPEHAVFIANVASLSLIIGLVSARLQMLPWCEWIGFGSAMDVALAVMLATYAWFMCHDNAPIRYE